MWSVPAPQQDARSAFISFAGYHEATNDSGRPLIRRIPSITTVSEGTAPLIRPLPPVSDEVPPLSASLETTEAAPVAVAVTIRRLPPVTLTLAAERAPSASVDFLRRWYIAGDAVSGVEEQAQAAVRQGYALAQKGALYSSRAEFIEALRAVSGALDAHYGQSQHTESLLAALLALKEADDFAAAGERLETTVDVSATTAVHRTRVIHEDEASHLSPVLAMQRYHAFAQQRFAAATGGAPIGAEALYALGKIHMSFSEPSNTAERMYGPKAMTFFSAALTADPRHAMAANELGVVYARFGKWQEARQVLQQSVGAHSLAEGWHNLAVVHEQLGEMDLAQQARQQAQLAAAQGRVQAAANAMVRWVDPSAFTNSGAPATAAPPETPTPDRTARRILPKLSWPW
jgi:tetratricopeptide (TPR) repeat protein